MANDSALPHRGKKAEPATTPISRLSSCKTVITFAADDWEVSDWPQAVTLSLKRNLCGGGTNYKAATPAILYVYSAVPSGGNIGYLWDSSKLNNAATAMPGAVKFVMPTVSDGYIFIAGGIGITGFRELRPVAVRRGSHRLAFLY